MTMTQMSTSTTYASQHGGPEPRAFNSHILDHVQPLTDDQRLAAASRVARAARDGLFGLDAGATENTAGNRRQGTAEILMALGLDSEPVVAAALARHDLLAAAS